MNAVSLSVTLLVVCICYSYSLRITKVTKPTRTVEPKKNATRNNNGPSKAAIRAKEAMQAELMARVKGYRDKCYPMPKDGCRCEEKRGVIRYKTDVQCRK